MYSARQLEARVSLKPEAENRCKVLAGSAAGAQPSALLENRRGRPLAVTASLFRSTKDDGDEIPTLIQDIVPRPVVTTKQTFARKQPDNIADNQTVEKENAASNPAEHRTGLSFFQVWNYCNNKSCIFLFFYFFSRETSFKIVFFFVRFLMENIEQASRRL